ncbi:alpha-lytic protease prodomain-containing protein, partial [Streptomyces albidoflavus]
MRNSRKCRLVAVGIALSASAVLGTQSMAQAQDTASTPRYQPEMVRALAASLGVSEAAAVERLDRQDAQQAKLAQLKKSGIVGDGAFFDASGKLTVNADDATEAARIEKAGLAARVPARGQAELDKVKAELDALAAKKVPSGVVAWSVDLASDKVTVKVADDRGAAAKAFLARAAKHGAAVQIVRGQEKLEAKAAIYPGSKMTFYNTSQWCSVGYGARDSAGRQYLVTAGHCVTNTLRYDGTALAQGYKTRYALGTRSVDMGLLTVNSGHSIVTAVGTWGQGSTS